MGEGQGEANSSLEKIRERLLISVVDQNGSIKSDNVKATYDGSEWTTSEVVNYSPSYQYYAYYPYSTSGLSNLGTSSAKGSIVTSGTSDASGTQAVGSRTSANGTSSANASFASNAQNASSSAIGAQAGNGTQVAFTRAVSANTSASDFFASGISAFTPATNQSTATNFNASDLQVGKATINRLDATDIDFTAMSHAMGMAKITLGTKSVPKEKTYYLSNDNSYTWSAPDESDMTTVTASGTSFSGNTPYNKGGTYYLIANPSKNTTVTSTATDGWTQTVKPSAANAVTSYTVQSKRTTVVVSDRKAFTLAIGDIYYTDGAVTHSTTHIDNYHSEIYPIGFVGYIGQNYWTEYNTGSGHGGHALVMCLRRSGATGVPTNVGKSYAWKTSNTDDGRTKVNNAETIINSYTQTYGSGYIESLALNNSEHPAIQAALEYNTLSAPVNKSTGWFLPSIGQCYALMSNFGYPETGWSFSEFIADSKSVSLAINDALTVAANGTGYTEFFQTVNGSAWASSEFNETDGTRIDSGIDDTKNWGDMAGAGSIRLLGAGYGNSSTKELRFTIYPFLAF